MLTILNHCIKTTLAYGQKNTSILGWTMRYLVKDETGQALRIFHTRAEAVVFMQQDWSLVVLPRKVKPNPLDIVGEAPF
jgi:hypothetical protein